MLEFEPTSCLLLDINVNVFKPHFPQLKMGSFLPSGIDLKVRCEKRSTTEAATHDGEK